MTDSDNVNRAFRPQPGRKYFNHMAAHTRGEWHRNWLLSSGQYIKTSEPNMRKGYGWKVVGEAGPELVNLHVVHPEDPYRPTAAELGIDHSRGHAYQTPHHRGSAADVELHWPGCGHE